MKKLVAILVTLLLIAVLPICKAQSDSASNKNGIAKNVVYVEALGSGYSYFYEFIFFGTVNYERNIICTPNYNYAIRMGFGYGGNSTLNFFHINNKDYSLFYALPLMFNFISNPDGNHHLDAGLGVILTNDGPSSRKNLEVGYTWNLKYRYQKKTKGIYFSAGWTPSVYIDHFLGSTFIYYVFGIQDMIIHLATVGTSVGYHF